MGKKIIIFYKNLIDIGGAERLLVKVYENLKLDGYDVKIIGYHINEEAFFNVNVLEKDLVRFGSKYGIINFIKMTIYLMKNKNSMFLCDSGHLDFYLSSVLAQINYSLHLHHPLYMSFNDYDKYSIFLNKHFDERIGSNHGADRFIKIRSSLTYYQKIKLNTRAYISILAIKKSLNNFVLSNYAKEEKLKLFNIKSKIVQGALDENIFNIKVNKIDSKYDKYDYIIFTVGRLDINKRIPGLIKAFQIIRHQNINAALLIGGKGPEYSNLEKITNDYGLQDDIYFLGFIQENKLFDYYKAADLFASIDWADFRITSYEALAMGSKVLLSNETDSDKFLLNSKYQYLTKPIPDETAKSIKEALLTKPTITKKELDKYLNNFTWNVYTKKIIQTMETNG